MKEKNKNEKISIGMDLSLTGTGVVVISNDKLIEKVLIKSKPIGKRPIDELHRIQKIIKQIFDIVDNYSPDIVVIEGLAMMARNTTALTQLSGMNYMIRDRLGEIQFLIVVPTMLKKFITGKGNIAKDVMLLEVYKKYNMYFTDDNLCDAYSLAMLGCAMINENNKLNEYQLETINKLKQQL